MVLDLLWEMVLERLSELTSGRRRELALEMRMETPLYLVLGKMTTYVLLQSMVARTLMGTQATARMLLAMHPKDDELQLPIVASLLLGRDAVKPLEMVLERHLIQPLARSLVEKLPELALEKHLMRKLPTFVV